MERTSGTYSVNFLYPICCSKVFFLSEARLPISRLSLRQLAIQTLKNLGYEYVRDLGSGTFGSVFAVTAKDGRKLAAKAVAHRRGVKGELEHWPFLQHENLLPLLEIITRHGIDIFLVPIYKCSLLQAVQNEDILSSRNGFQHICKWLTDLLPGLQYMHERKLCHLDLKADNVLISSGYTAKISDFSCVSETTKEVKGAGLPMRLRPPEAYVWQPSEWEMAERPKIQGIPFDIWAYGMLANDIFTGHFLKNKFSMQYTWKKSVYPSLFKALQIPKFYELVEKAYPAAQTKWEELESARNLVRGTLRLLPQHRPQASLLLKHPLMSKTGDRVPLVCDQIWKNNRQKEMNSTRPAFDVTDLSKDYRLRDVQMESIKKNVEEIIEKAVSAYIIQGDGTSVAKKKKINVCHQKNQKKQKCRCYSCWK